MKILESIKKMFREPKRNKASLKQVFPIELFSTWRGNTYYWIPELGKVLISGYHAASIRKTFYCKQENRIFEAYNPGYTKKFLGITTYVSLIKRKSLSEVLKDHELQVSDYPNYDPKIMDTGRRVFVFESITKYDNNGDELETLLFDHFEGKLVDQMIERKVYPK